MKFNLVLLAGGSGQRLWPISTSSSPKQFLNLTSKKDSLFNLTIKRLAKLEIDHVYAICNVKHQNIARNSLKSNKQSSSIIFEPIGRNTAPAIAVSAFLSESDEDALLLVLPSDHLINNEKRFCEIISNAIPLANEDKLITFGIKPSKPHCGYGYIKYGQKYKNSFYIEEFIEKPSQKYAKKYFESGSYLWNSGMFLVKASKYLNELEKHRPDIYKFSKLAYQNIKNRNGELYIPKSFFEKCPSESIDYAIMEKTDEACVIPVDIGWNDIGSWNSLWEIQTKDVSNNVLIGDVYQYRTKNSYIRSEGQLIAAVGVEDLIIVSTEKSVLIAKKENEQDIKSIVNMINQNHNEDT